EQTAVTLSTIHRAKGLEADRVFLLHPERVPLRWENQQAWELEQEMNLRYVALTRAKQALFFVEEPPKRKRRRFDED
ncbi:MAG TPA: 3'-5' exonuclease, partial [Roseiflexaceae bacterium]|nr:3'-5' exonuclease [Roseiflexaceae bacterium]